MPSAIDHVVVAVHNLDQAIEDFKELGFNVFFGGDHKHRGSHNALITFQDGSYIEVIAFKHEPPVKDNDWWDLLQEREGFVDFAVVVDDVEAEATRLGHVGIPVNDVFTGGRATSDGQNITWRLVRVPDAPGVPFLIDDVTDRTLRVPQGERAEHRNGVTGISSVTVGVESVEATSATYGAIFGTDGPPFNAGPHRIDLVANTGGRPGVQGVVLHGSGESGVELPLKLTHGARFTFA